MSIATLWTPYPISPNHNNNIGILYRRADTVYSKTLIVSTLCLKRDTLINRSDFFKVGFLRRVLEVHIFDAISRDDKRLSVDKHRVWYWAHSSNHPLNPHTRPRMYDGHQSPRHKYPFLVFYSAKMKTPVDPQNQLSYSQEESDWSGLIPTRI